MIKIQNYDKEKQKLSFITDMPIILANVIRRGVLEIPILAIDEVEISQNDSALYDEILAHRIGLIPINTDKTIKEIKFKLKEEGPKTVYSTDITPDIGTAYKLPIVILDKDQEIQLVANAKIGRGIEHIKYSPGLAYYNYNIDPEILDFVSINGDGEINYDEKELKDKKISEDILNKIRKLTKTNELIFNIESWGQIDVKKIFTESIDILNKNLNELNKSIK